MAKVNASKAAPKNATLLSAPAVKAPAAKTPAAPASVLGKTIAAQQKVNSKAATQAATAAATTGLPATGTAIQQAAKAGFTRTVQNGRGDYTPNSIGALIWQTASALQAATPSTPVTSAAVRLALPHVKPASVSAGLSHWRKFNGTMRVKGQTAKPAAPASVTA